MSGPISDYLADVNFESFIDIMKDGDWFKYFFAFLLIYAIVFTILEKVKIFKDEEGKSNKKAVRIIIAFIFSLFAVAFPVNDNGDFLGDVIATLFPGVGVFAMGILGLYIVAAMMDADLFSFLDGTDNKYNKYIKWVLGGIGTLWVVYYFGSGMGYWEDDSLTNNFLVDILKDPFLIIIVIVVLLFYWINSDPDKPKTPSSNP